MTTISGMWIEGPDTFSSIETAEDINRLKEESCHRGEQDSWFRSEKMKVVSSLGSITSMTNSSSGQNPLQSTKPTKWKQRYQTAALNGLVLRSGPFWRDNFNIIFWSSGLYWWFSNFKFLEGRTVSYLCTWYTAWLKMGLQKIIFNWIKVVALTLFSRPE